MEENNREPNNNPQGAEGGADEDVEFGDFEGFEGAAGLLEGVQAQPAPSPWATFPDLLPVQTSPATPAEEGEAAAAAGDGWAEPPGLSNPPDVSLGARPSIDPHHLGGAMGGAPAEASVDMARLQARVRELEHQLEQAQRESAVRTIQLQQLREEQERRRHHSNHALLQRLAHDVQESTTQCAELRANFQQLSLRLDSFLQNPLLDQRLTSTVQQAVEAALRHHHPPAQGAGAGNSPSSDLSEVLRRELDLRFQIERRVASRETREMLGRLFQALQKECQGDPHNS